MNNKSLWIIFLLATAIVGFLAGRSLGPGESGGTTSAGDSGERAPVIR